MSDAGDIEVENVQIDILPKDVAKDVGNVKLFGRWDYDVEVRDISLTYETPGKSANGIASSRGGIGDSRWLTW